MNNSNKEKNMNNNDIEQQLKEEIMQTQEDKTVGSIHPLSENFSDFEQKEEISSFNEETKTDAPKAKDPNIGSMLKRVREEKGLSIKVVSQQTKIHLALLEALEENQLIRLPSKTYVKGFVKAYAKLLNINQNDAIVLFENTYREYEGLPIISHDVPANMLNINNNTASSIPTKPQGPSEFSRMIQNNGLNILKISGALVAVIVIGFNLKTYVETTLDEKKVVLPEVLSTTSKPKNLTAPKAPAPTPTVEEKKPEPVKEINIITKDAIKPEIKLNDELTLKPISSIEKQQKEISLTEEKMSEYLPARFRVNAGAGVETVFINAIHGDSWLTYKTDENEIKKFVLRQGRTLFLKGKLVRLFIGNTKNVQVFYNNKPIEFITTTGVKNAVFPESQKANFMNPLFVFQKDGTVITSEDAAKNAQVKPVTPTNQIPAPSVPSVPAVNKTEVKKSTGPI